MPPLYTVAATRPRGVGPVVARSATRRRAKAAVVARRATHRRAIFTVIARAAPVVARPCTLRCPTLYPSSGVAYPSSPVFFQLPYPSSCVADSLLPAVDPSSRAASRRHVLQTRRRALWTRRRALHTRRCTVRTRRRDPSRARPAPVRASPISTRVFYYFPTLCQSILACTCHGDCLRDSLKDASHFSSHVIHHD